MENVPVGGPGSEMRVLNKIMAWLCTSLLVSLLLHPTSSCQHNLSLSSTSPAFYRPVSRHLDPHRSKPNGLPLWSSPTQALPAASSNMPLFLPCPLPIPKAAFPQIFVLQAAASSFADDDDEDGSDEPWANEKSPAGGWAVGRTEQNQGQGLGVGMTDGFLPGMIWEVAGRTRGLKDFLDERRAADVDRELQGDELARVEAYSDWLAEIGVDAFGPGGSVKIKAVDFGDPIPFPPSSPSPSSPRASLGLFASRRIQQGEVILSIPRPWWLSTQGQQPLFKGADTDISAAALLLRERAKGQDSKFAPLVQMVPESFPGSPLFWPQLSVEMLTNEIKDEIASSKASLQAAFDQIDPSSISNASFAEFLWAIAAVRSRTIVVYSRSEPLDLTPDAKDEQRGKERICQAEAGEGGRGGTCDDVNSALKDEAVEFVRLMLPGIDLVNHHFHYNADCMDATWNSNKTFLLVATADISEGDEILVSYAADDASFLLQNFGFMPYHNPYEQVTMFISVQELVHFYAESILEPEKDAPLNVSLAEENIQLAISAVEEQGKTFGVNERQMSPLELDGNALSLRANGFWDPRYFAAFAAVSFTHAEGRKIEDDPSVTSTLAKVSLSMAYQNTQTGCENLGPSVESPNLHSAILEAVYYMWQIADGMLEDLGSTFDDEMGRLKRTVVNIAPCDAEDGIGRPVGQGMCSWPPLTLGVSEELAMRYRMSRMLVLQNGLEFLETICPDNVKNDDFND